MDAGNSRRQAAYPDLRKASFGKHIGKHFLAWKGADRFGKIAIAICITRDDLSHYGQNIKRKAVI